MFHTLRIWALTLGAVATAWSPATSQAGCLDWLFGCRSCNYCDPCGGRTTYRPIFPRLSYYGGSNCNSCSTSCYSPCSTSCHSPCATSCCTQYVPQTSYRACYVNVPVTTCQAVSACDPCTGCPVTVMRPVTSYVQQVRYTPVVTYRAVCPTTCASPCGDSCGSSFGSAATYSPGGSCCSPSAPVTIPSTSTPSPMPQTYKPETGAYRAFPTQPYDTQRNYNTNYRGQEATPPPPPRPALTTELPQRTWTFRRVSTQDESAATKPLENKPVETKNVETKNDGWRARQR